MTRPCIVRQSTDMRLACGLWPQELDLLATYNAERSRGLVHDEEWIAAMADLQRRFDESAR